MADDKAPIDFAHDEKPDEKYAGIADTARRQSVALNIVENPLKVRFAITTTWLSPITKTSANANKHSTAWHP